MSDRYTKFILTVIAVALCGDLAERLIRPAQAAPVQTSPSITRVALCDATNPNACAAILEKQVSHFDANKGWVSETRNAVGVLQQ